MNNTGLKMYCQGQFLFFIQRNNLAYISYHAIVVTITQFQSCEQLKKKSVDFVMCNLLRKVQFNNFHLEGAS